MLQDGERDVASSVPKEETTMHFRRRTVLVSSLFLFVAPGARAEVTYPPGTTIEEAWFSPPRIEPEEAARRLAELFLAAHDGEFDLGPEDFEAAKYLVGENVYTVEEEPVQPGMRRYGGEVTPENMTAEQEAFFARLSTSLAAALGLASVVPTSGCVEERRLWEATKYKTDIGWNEVEVWGITAFGHNVRYGLNQSDVVYGVFPWGIQMSWWGAIQCALDEPTNEEELRACGRAKEWKLHGASSMKLTNAYEHAVPGVAQASLTFAGALASGRAGQFQTNEQTRETLDSTWLLGGADTPLPSKVSVANALCTSCSTGPATDAVYTFSRVLAWHPDIVLNAAHNNLVQQRYDVFVYSGNSDGNPHALPSWTFRKTFSRYHEPFPGCS